MTTPDPEATNIPSTNMINWESFMFKMHDMKPSRDHPAPEAIKTGTIQPSPRSDTMLSIHADDGSEMLAILPNGTVRGTIENAGPAAQLFVAEMRGMTEAIAAKAKAEALREAAEAMPARLLIGLEGEYDGNDYHREWLRARAAMIEGKDS
ncbi:hypothetical protein [Arthrobacter sp. HY1533]|uniref:hypothetical protein n=1 Tax=Arthrobacter sp. HY1533 TaxID=2970919 RepID=UPI0022B9F202|nr:hypothetical protein [Arthrobacter sp. HY1533]